MSHVDIAATDVHISVRVDQYTIVRLYGSLTYAWVRIFIEVFRFPMERVYYCNMEE